LIRRFQSTIDLLMVNGAITWVHSDVNALHFVHDAWNRSPVRTTDVRSGVHTWYHSLYTWLNTAWERWSLHRTKHAVAVSTMVKEQVMALGLDVPVHVIPNGIDLEAFSPSGPTVPRAELGVPPNVPLALFAGDIRTSLKNLDTVLGALRDVPRLHLIVAGTVQGSPYPSLARELGVDDRVHFLDFRRDIPALMRTADMLVFPSRYETFSLVLLEAMASGTPVITARTVGAAEFVPPDGGIVVEDPNDTEAIVDALRQLVASPDRREEMGRVARDTARQHDIRITANKYVDLFERLLQRWDGLKQPA
jgi:glycosyltransferase involved in cell wall biosynthesis